MRRLMWILAFMAVCGAASAQPFQANYKNSVVSTIIANNTTAIPILNKGGTTYQIEAFSNNTTLAYIKLYDALAANVTCGSGTPKWRGMIPYGTSSSGGGFALPDINGTAFAFGITMCVTTGIADSDTGAPAATSYIVNVKFAPN